MTALKEKMKECVKKWLGGWYSPRSEREGRKTASPESGVQQKDVEEKSDKTEGKAEN